MKDVVLPEKTVFKISLNDNISSKTNLVGDPVEFTVQEDVKVGDILCAAPAVPEEAAW